MSERLILGDKSFDVKIRRSGDNFTLHVGEDEFSGSYSRTLDGGINIQFDKSNSICYTEKNLDEIYVFANGKNYFFKHQKVRFDSVEQEEVSDDRVLSPITGKLLDNKVAHGSQVSKGDVVLVLEAMKMEHRLTAPRDGKISSITAVEIGGQVKEGDFMFELEGE
tara:strand:- start:1472 stop:1966 length:495 start_codon:yes stop_codon:yes gene_type:complete